MMLRKVDTSFRPRITKNYGAGLPINAPDGLAWLATSLMW